MRRLLLFLARTVFHCHPDALAEQLSMADLLEWQAEPVLTQTACLAL